MVWGSQPPSVVLARLARRATSSIYHPPKPPRSSASRRARRRASGRIVGASKPGRDWVLAPDQGPAARAAAATAAITGH